MKNRDGFVKKQKMEAFSQLTYYDRKDFIVY